MAKNNKTNHDDTPTPENDLATALLLKEADEALRQEKLEALWKEWGSTVISVALMIIFGTMIGVGWKNWRQSVHQDQTTQLIAVQGLGSQDIQTNTSDDALSGQYVGISALLDAGLVKFIGENDENAMKQMHNYMSQALAADIASPYDYMAAWGVLRTRSTIEQTPETKIEIAEEMIDLADHNDNPYQSLILIEAATLYGEHGNTARALEILKDVQTNTQNIPAITAVVQDLTRLYETEIARAQEQAQEKD